MNRLAAVILVALSIICTAAGSAFAQAPDPLRQRLDATGSALEQIELSLARPNLSAEELQQLRAEMDPISASIQAVLDELTPRLNAAKARLDQLGTQPADKNTTEPAAVVESRAQQQKLFDGIDAAFRRAHLLALQAAQVTANIGARRRVLFTHSLFERTPSILSPTLWLQVFDELPRSARALRLLASDWFNAAANRLDAVDLGLIALLVATIGALYVPLSRFARSLASREAHLASPTRLQRVLAALRVAVLTAALPILAAVTLAFIIGAFDLVNVRLQPLIWGIVDSVKRIATAVGIARGMLAAGRPNWRVIKLGDKAADRILRLVAVVAVIVSAFKLVETVNDIISAPLIMSVAVRSIGSLLVAVAIAFTLTNIAGEGEAGENPEARPGAQSGWRGPIRFAAWIIAVIIVGAALVGYVALGAFLVDQIVWIAAVGALAYLSTVLVDDGIDAVLRPSAPLGRSIVSSLGLRRESLEQLGALLAGAAHVAVVVASALLVLVPWGLHSEDIFSYLKAAFFGFTVGDVTISLSTIVVALLLFLLAILATRGVQGWLDAKFMPRTKLDTGLRNSIRTSVGYLGVVVAASVALSYLGLSFEKFALVAGALSVGIGFGLQSIVSNFVSGLILLWERAIRVGDWIIVGQEEGYVRRINVRSTEIETFERATVIVPNSSLVTGVVKNWVRSDRVGRVKIAIGVAYDADPEIVRDILISCAKSQESVLAIPAPGVFFTKFGESAIEFELICFVDDVEMAGRINSDLHFAIFRRLREAGIAIPYPRRDVRLRKLDSIGPSVTRPASADGADAAERPEPA